MIKLRGHYDGRLIVLDEPPPPELTTNTAVQVTLLSRKDQAVQEIQGFLNELWSRPLPKEIVKDDERTWKREEMYVLESTNGIA